MIFEIERFVVLVVKNPRANAADTREAVQSLGRKGPLEKETATHSSIIAWRIPWTEEPGGYSPDGLAKSQTRLKVT